MRRSKRFPLDIELVITSLKQQHDSKEIVDVPIKVSNISKEGIGFSSSVSMEVGTFYAATICISNIRSISSVLKIIRRSEVQESGDWFYGCEIVGHPSVYDFVFDEYEKALEEKGITVEQ